MLFLKFMVLVDRFLAMHVAMSPDLVGVFLPLSNSGIMACKRVGSKDTDRSATGVVVGQVSTSFPIYEDTKLIVEKDMKLKWQEVNDAFTGTFGEYLKDCQVYVNIHKFDLYQITCSYPVFPCMNMIHWVVSHTDLKTMTLSSDNRMDIATFRVQDYEQTYHMSKSVVTVETPFSISSNISNSRDILKSWVKELAKFRMTPN